MKKELHFLILAMAFCTGIEKSIAQEQINTGRPSFSENAYMVKPRSLQFENGSGYYKTGTVKSYAVPDVAFRFGLANRLEGRVATTHWLGRGMPLCKKSMHTNLLM